MQIAIGDILSPEQVEAVQTALRQARFVDGRETAGFAAREVKRNTQAAGTDRSLDPVRKLIADCMLSNDVFRLAVRAKALALSVFALRARHGIRQPRRRRPDARHAHGFSFTLFLSDPQSYDGGELIIDGPSGEDANKLAAGSLLAYPSTSLHRVGAVTRGERLAATGWARSLSGIPRSANCCSISTRRPAVIRARRQECRIRSDVQIRRQLLRMWAEIRLR